MLQNHLYVLIRSFCRQCLRVQFCVLFLFGILGRSGQANPLIAPELAAKRVVVEKAKISSRALLQLSHFHHIDLSMLGQSRTETGTAFCWDSSGAYLTAEHVIGASRSISLENGFPLSVQKKWVFSDLALLSGPPCQPVERRHASLSIGETILLRGYSPSNGWQTQIGIVVEQERPRLIGYALSPPLIGINAEIGPGFSGGMALDDQGRLVGMIQAAELGSMAYVMTTQRLLSVINQTPVFMDISLSSGQIVGLKSTQSQERSLPIKLLAVNRFGMEWTDPRSAFYGMSSGETLSISTGEGVIELTAAHHTERSLRLIQTEGGWLVLEPGVLLGQMGLLPNDTILRLSGAIATGEPPKTLRGMLKIRRGKMTYSVLAP